MPNKVLGPRNLGAQITPTLTVSVVGHLSTLDSASLSDKCHSLSDVLFTMILDIVL